MITLGGHYEIDPGAELPGFAQPHCPAYAVEDDRQPERALFALVTPNDMAPRHDLIRYLTRLGNLPMIRPLAMGIVDWTPTGDQRLIIVYEQPGGQRLASLQNPTFQALREDDLQDKIVAPALAVLREFHARGYTHRAIRADNLFFSDAEKTSFVLGECVSVPPALDQPALYETVESGQATPAGRGPGWNSDDLYALGVLIAVLLSGGKLCEGMSDQEIVQSKIANGSYGALIGRNRLSMATMELLRGLLCDIPSERWGLKDLHAWVEGRRQTPKQPLLPRKGSRPFDLGKEAYWTSKALSAAAGVDWDKALEMCQDSGLPGWFTRSLGDDKLAEELSNLQRSGLPAQSGGPPHRLACETLITIDPQAPLRYRSLAFFPEAAAQVLAIGWDQQDQRQNVAEVLRNRLAGTWFDAQKGGGAEHPLLRKNLTTMQQFAAQPRLGYGLERVMYEFNANWPCRSPILGGAYVHSLLGLIPALDRIAAEDEESTREPIDLHLVGFVAARSRHLPERILAALARSEDQTTYRLAILRLFAEVQRETVGDPCPAFANWLARLTGPIIESYHSSEARRAAAKAIKAAADSGNLEQLLIAADNPNLRGRDRAGLEAAMREYQAIEEEMDWLESGAMVSDSFVRERAQRFAAVACGCLASFSFLLLTIYYVA